jgi:hypothetical protein
MLAAIFDSQATQIRLSPNGQVIIGDDGTLWNAADGLLAGSLPGVRGPAVDFAFTPDGARLIWQGQGSLVEVWALP